MTDAGFSDCIIGNLGEQLPWERQRVTPAFSGRWIRRESTFVGVTAERAFGSIRLISV